MNEEKYVQCRLIKWVDPNDDHNGFLITISWLPEKFAKVYNVLKLKNDDGTWSDGWQVTDKYTTHTKEFVLAHERDFAKQREASDI